MKTRHCVISADDKLHWAINNFRADFTTFDLYK